MEVRRRFWSDDFDMDLLSLWPDLPGRLGAIAEVPLWTYGGESYGRLNHPSVWNSNSGDFIAFFGLTPETIGKPDSYWTDRQVIECTWLEALRDCWSHHYTILCADRILWRSPWGPFERLMADLRGYGRLAVLHRDQLRGTALASILAATSDLNALLTGRTPR